MAVDTYEELPVGSIYYDKSFNCRGEFVPQSCLDLAQSIKEHGLQFPIVVQSAEDVELPSGYAYRLIVGHRRFIAITELLQQSTILAHVRRGLTEKQARVLNLIENLERKNITLLDEANAVRAIFSDQTPYTQMARELSKSDAWCRVRWLLSTLSEEIQKDCAAGRLSSTDAAMLIAEKEEYRIALANELKIAKAAGIGAKRRKVTFTKMKTGRGRRQIQRMLAHLMGEGLEPTVYRALTWAAGNITDAELLENL